MAYEELKPTGITEDTPKNIVLGSGTIHKGLAFSEGVWNFATSLIGATSGGTKISIKPEITDIEVDGALVKVKGLAHKTGETATMGTNIIELTPDMLKAMTLGEDGTSTLTGYNVIEGKAQITEGDYITNLGYVGRYMDGRPVIVIFDNALCTSGFEGEGKTKENGIYAATFECYADLTDDPSTLPYHIYFPTAG